MINQTPIIQLPAIETHQGPLHPHKAPANHSLYTRLHEAAPLIRSKKRLERGLSVLDELLEVGLVPGTSLGSGLEGVFLSAVRIVAGGAGIRSTVRLTTGLNPDEGVDERVAGGASGADTETGTLDVAPVTPLLAEASDGVAASIDDGLAGHAGALELGGEQSHVLLLVLGLVPLRVGGLGELSWRQVVRVPASDVGGITADLLGGAGILVDIGKHLGTGLCNVC